MTDILQTKLGYTFKRHALLRSALTHSSFAHEQKLNPAESNQRLEFLGDAVLELCISDVLYHRYADMDEGELTKKRASFVCESTLAEIAKDLGLGNFLLLGQGEAREGGREKDSILADALESILGAVFLDGGIEETSNIVRNLFGPVMDKKIKQTTDSKSLLQEILQKQSKTTASYEIIHEEGPPHQKIFTSSVFHDGKKLGTGKGSSKKAAEQEAAKAALEKMNAV